MRSTLVFLTLLLCTLPAQGMVVVDVNNIGSTDWTTDVTWESLYKDYEGPQQPHKWPRWYVEESQVCEDMITYIVTADEARVELWEVLQDDPQPFRNYVGYSLSTLHADYLASVPEPATVVIMGLGFLVLVRTPKKYKKHLHLFN